MFVGLEGISSKTALGAILLCIESIAKGWNRVTEHKVGYRFQWMRFPGKNSLMWKGPKLGVVRFYSLLEMTRR